MNMPILRIELEGIRESVARALVTRNDEINKLILDSLESQLQEEWVIESIDSAVKAQIKKSIDDVSTNWELRMEITRVVSESISKIFSDKHVK